MPISTFCATGATERERDEATAKLADMEARARDAERDADIAELQLATGTITLTEYP